MSNHSYYMQKVIELAKLTPWQTLPNPQVAAIIVNNGIIVGMGCHLQAGGPHAEIHALHQAGALAHGATLYINLEPCCHHGRTGPCSEAVIKAGIRNVYIANLDPNPLVAGKGVQHLQDAGIMVKIGLLADEATAINQIFYHNILTKQPYVTLKAGLSLDGRIATKDNLSQWITSPESRQDAHNLRISHDAILVGINTILSDNPSLTPHLLENPARQPIRIILDRQLRTPFSAKVITDKLATTWICTTNDDSQLHAKYQALGIKIMLFTELNITNLLTDLYQKGICSLLVEGGEQIYSSFIDANLVNQLVIYYSPQLIGSKSAKHLYAGNGFSNLTTNPKFELISVDKLATDVKMVLQNKSNLNLPTMENQ